MAYTLSGIAARCDWVLHSDLHAPHTHLHRSNPTDAPLHIFLSLRNSFAAIATFTTKVLCGHRVRQGPQWDLRRTITERARAD